MSFFNTIFGTSGENKPLLNSGWRSLSDLGQLNEIINLSTEKPVVIFKHSTRCSVSRMVLNQFQNEFDFNEIVVPYFLDLIEYRNISNEIAIRFGVQHQSPQVIVICNGKAFYNASHESIEVVTLAKHLTSSLLLY